MLVKLCHQTFLKLPLTFLRRSKLLTECTKALRNPSTWSNKYDVELFELSRLSRSKLEKYV